ncbi:MAG: hypothetical protein PHE32_00305 [Candidatus Shapirobacteria bacterium]|nr:hypothetical protein [Candidatus Shapirobacteria bacterium]MDD4410139.1 hypothetical protein [Candidatus Shapirobacteria bacterium]
MKINQIIATLVLLVVAAGAAFFGGVKFQQKKITSQFSQRINNNAAPGQGTGRGTGIGKGENAFNQTVGEIISIDDSSLTVKTSDGGSKIILISDSTTVNQSTTAAKTDLKVGAKIAVMGSTNTDGSVTSKTIEINPSIGNMAPPVTTGTPAAKN